MKNELSLVRISRALMNFCSGILRLRYTMVKKKSKRKRKRRVKEPLTDELLEKLLSSDNPIDFVTENKVVDRSLPEYLQQLLDEKGLKRSTVVEEAGLNPTYGYEIFVGRKHASRNYVLQIAFALKATLQEANRILQAAGHNELYCKNRRDAIIIFCLDHGYTLMRTDEELEGTKIYASDIDPKAVKAAKENAALNGITNCEFIADDVLQAVDHIGIQPDLIILDPPRDGIHPKALPRILKFGVPHILYISCKPKSLARDLPAFLAAGYAPVRGCCVDEFPWTQHIETIVLLQKLNS